MSLLTEKFNMIDAKISKKQSLLIEKEMLEVTYKDNEILQKYIKILDDISKIESDEKVYKDSLYELMLAEDIDNLQGTSLDVSLKRPYSKTEFATKEFLEYMKNPDSKEEQTLLQKIFTKFVKNKTVKGNVSLKILKD